MQLNNLTIERSGADDQSCYVEMRLYPFVEGLSADPVNSECWKAMPRDRKTGLSACGELADVSRLWDTCSWEVK